MTLETGVLETSELDKVIAPEIKDDAFHRLIEKLAAEEQLDYVLEIGSSAGGGSTGAFLAGLARNKGRPKLFCVEVSRARSEVLRNALRPYAFAHCYNRSSVSVGDFPSQTDIIRFYNGVKTNLNDYPVAQVLQWLQQDIDYVGGAGVEAGAIEQIKMDHDISQFDMVLIDGSEFTGDVEFAKIDGARIILLDDTNTFKCYNVRERLLRDPDYELIADDQAVRNGFSAFRRRDGRSKPLDLPIHFFTIVLNGEPFIRYHEDVFASLTQRWHWHVIEGVAALKHDTAWSVEAGGRVADSAHDQGRSNDGTTAYLDDLARRFPDRVTVYRKPAGEFWDGKREMVAAPLPNIKDECLLWQVDADELWTAEQIDTVHAMFAREPDRTAAMYWCWYFVGPRKIISTRYNYAQNPQQEWLRTWRYKPGDSWFAHEPPVLARASPGSEPTDIAKIRPFTHDEMERAGAVFQHFAYAMESQLAFKETYYGYKDARTQWRQLQSQLRSGLLRDFLKWVPDETVFDAVEPYWIDLLAVENQDGTWRFRGPRQAPLDPISRADVAVVLDGLIWQSGASESRRFWTGVLHEWARSGFADKVVVVDRGGTAPRIEGIHYWTIPRYVPDRAGHDSLNLERLCRMFAARLFVSTLETTPTETASCVVRFTETHRLPSSNDSEGHRASLHATAEILVRAEPPQPSGQSLALSIGTLAVPPGVSAAAARDRMRDADTFRREYKIGSKPYVMVAGEQSESVAPIVAAASLLTTSQDGVVFFTTLAPASISALRAELAPQVDMRHFEGSDEAWLAAVAGAQALICSNLSAAPTLAALEGMALGCPVILCGYSAARTALGAAVLYVGADDPVGIAASLRRLLDPSIPIREGVIAQGHEAAQRFSLEQSASALAAALLQVDGGNRDSASPVDRRGWVALRTHQRAAESAREAAALSMKAGQVEGANGSPRSILPAFLGWLTGRNQNSA